MPLKTCVAGGKPGYKWGDDGRCYTYEPNSEGARKAAKAKALKHGYAIGEHMDPKLLNVQTRAARFEVDAERASSKEGGIPVVVSTDTPVVVPDFGGPEVLVHSAEAIDMSRAPLPIIATHDEGQINVGVIEGLQIAGGQLRGIARFGVRPEAKGYEEDVRGGIIRSISVGYSRVKGRVVDGVLTITRWVPRHAAMVAEPADVGAGFFRNLSEIPPFDLEADGQQASRDAKQSQPAVSATTKGVLMDPNQTAAAVPAGEVQVIDHAAPERLRIKTLQALARTHKVDDATRDEWIDGGVTSEEAAQKVLDIIAERSKAGVKESPAFVNMDPKDLRQYSITRAIKACVEKSWPKVAPFEAEMSNHVAKRMGRQSGEHNFYVPLDVQWAAAMQRDLVVATASLGGAMVGTNVMSFIDQLRNRSVVMRLGATTMPGLVGSVAIPKQLTGATAYWFASEAGTATESNQTFGQLALVPKTVGGYVEISRQLLLQSTPNAEGIVNADLAKVIGLAVDSAALTGPGTAGQPTGISATSGVGTANPATGTAITYADMIRFQTTVAGSNAMMPGFGYVTTPVIAGILMGKPRFTNSDTPIWGGNILDGTLVGARAMTSLQVSSATMFAGDFSQVVIGEWGVLEIEANPYAQFQSGIVGVRALYTVDVGVRYAAAFAIGTDMTA